MIPKYINDWLTIIEQMNNDNTYKLAWGRSVIECVCLGNCYEENREKVNKGMLTFSYESIELIKE